MPLRSLIGTAILAILAIAGSTAGAAAETTDCLASYQKVADELSAATSDTERQLFYREHGNRCEGFVGTLTGFSRRTEADYFDLLGLVAGWPGSPPARGTRILLQLASVPYVSAEPVHVAVLSLPRYRPDYRLDSTLRDGRLYWPLNDVVIPAIEHRFLVWPDLSAVAYQDLQSRRVFLPIDGTYATQGGKTPAGKYQAVIRPVAPVWQRRWQICKVGEPCCDQLMTSNVITETEAGSEPFQIDFPRPSDSDAAGLYCLTVSASFCPPVTGAEAGATCGARNFVIRTTTFYVYM